MNVVTFTKTFAEPPFCEREILRYAGCKNADEELSRRLHDCKIEVWDRLSYRVCYRELPVSIREDICDFGLFQVRSKDLARNLQDCGSAILFAATVGIEIDRLIAKYGRVSPSKALLFQAIGAERIEALCDAFCDSLTTETGLTPRPRFSPGYGDLPIALQNEIFSVLDCNKRIGLFLNDSMLMSPSKSVTAFVGLGSGETKKSAGKCSTCNQKDCFFRGAL